MIAKLFCLMGFHCSKQIVISPVGDVDGTGRSTDDADLFSRTIQPAGGVAGLR